MSLVLLIEVKIVKMRIFVQSDQGKSVFVHACKTERKKKMYIESMSSLKEQVIQKVGVMSDADLAFFVEILDRLSYKSSETPRTACKIGICRNQKLVADGYDIDEDNEEIAMLFEGV